MGRPAGSKNKARGPVPIRKQLFVLMSNQKKELMFHDMMSLYQRARELSNTASIKKLEKTSSVIKSMNRSVAPLKPCMIKRFYKSSHENYVIGQYFREARKCDITREYCNTSQNLGDYEGCKHWLNVGFFSTRCAASPWYHTLHAVTRTSQHICVYVLLMYVYRLYTLHIIRTQNVERYKHTLQFANMEFNGNIDFFFVQKCDFCDLFFFTLQDPRLHTHGFIGVLFFLIITVAKLFVSRLLYAYFRFQIFLFTNLFSSIF